MRRSSAVLRGACAPFFAKAHALTDCECNASWRVEMVNVNGLTLFLAFNINNITTTGLSNNNSLTLRAVHLTLTEIGAVSA